MHRCCPFSHNFRITSTSLNNRSIDQHLLSLMSNVQSADSYIITLWTSLLCRLNFSEVEHRSLCVHPSPTCHRRILTYHLCDTCRTQKNAHITAVALKQDVYLWDGKSFSKSDYSTFHQLTTVNSERIYGAINESVVCFALTSLPQKIKHECV